MARTDNQCSAGASGAGHHMLDLSRGLLMQSLKTMQLAGLILVAVCILAPRLSVAQDQQYGSDYIIVAPGMTLTRIMREYYPQHRSNWPALMDEIIRINPHAFVNSAPASLKRG
ncbi:MAG: hypothetical protein OEN20_08540, partial [Gammaproteobacteria bacterium]|nr:hypothetical protein [Gammaproteobacteria bacterium]